MQKLENILFQFLKKYEIFDTQKKVLIAISGGVDSVVLSICSISVFKQISLQPRIGLIHLNHNWRKDDSKKDEVFCQNLAKRFVLPFYSQTLSENEKQTEENARKLRYEFYNKACQYFDTDVVLTAHNLNDTVETFLYRMIKGSDTFGLASIPHCRKYGSIKILRPFLSVSRDDIEDYAKENSLEFRFDKSNDDIKYKRNYIRNKILPLFERINPKYKINIKNLINSITLEKDYFEALLSNLNIINEEKIQTNKFLGFDIVIQKKIIANLLRRSHFEYDYKRIDYILKFILKNRDSRSGKIMSIDNLNFLFVNENYFRIVKRLKGCLKVQISKLGVSELVLDESKVFKIRRIEGNIDKYPKDSDNIAIVSFDNVKFPLTIRFREPGDIICPFGMCGRKMKLKKYLINKHVPQYARDRIILLTKGKEVLWVNGVGLSEKLRVKGDSDRYMLSIEEKKEKRVNNAKVG